MLLHAVNGTLTVPGGEMDYIAFGAGRQPLVMVPGLGDGMKTVKGTALPFAWAYRAYARAFRVYVFSRVNGLPAGYTTRDMARDTAQGMEGLGISSGAVMGVSQGGMIAQYLALDCPDKVERLVLAVTAARPNPVLKDALTSWIDMADKGEYTPLMLDTARRSYSDAYLRRNRLLLPLFARVGKPASMGRFLIQARACLSHDAFAQLHAIACPTLAVGGEEDRIVGPAASLEIAGEIPGCALHMFPALGHAVYEETPDFHRVVLDFLGQATV